MAEITMTLQDNLGDVVFTMKSDTPVDKDDLSYAQRLATVIAVMFKLGCQDEVVDFINERAIAELAKTQGGA